MQLDHISASAACNCTGKQHRPEGVHMQTNTEDPDKHFRNRFRNNYNLVPLTEQPLSYGPHQM